MLSERQKNGDRRELHRGRIASQITRIAGASEVFDAGFVTTQTEMKTRFWRATRHSGTEGAVSEAVVKGDGGGALRVTGAQLAIAVSGIAGPSGGTPENPLEPSGLPGKSKISPHATINDPW